MTPRLVDLGRVLRRVSPVHRLYGRWLLSRAKHPSLHGHPRMALGVARLLRGYAHGDAEFFDADGAPDDVARRRRQGFTRLAAVFAARSPEGIARTRELEGDLSDLAFVNAHRVPFPFQPYVQANMPVDAFAEETDGARIRDLDGNWSYDLSGGYGVNLFGSEFYKQCIDRGVERARNLGVVLGPYHPDVLDNVRRLKAISGLDEVSFHMSGTEAVMQAVRLARYHTKRSHLVRFCGAYHGWWDGVQAGVGNPRPARDVFTLREMHPDTLRVLRTRHDIACVLVNPIQALHPNAGPASDSTLLSSDRAAHFDKGAYRRWLQELREVCSSKGIALILDEVFLGFRLAPGGAQEFFGVAADLVTYGKSVGGGLPVGVLCGRAHLMRRFVETHPMDICFARGTFNSHPYVMATMNEFLRHLDDPAVRRSYGCLDEVWNRRTAALNARLAAADVPVRVAHLLSVWTTLYTRPSAYNWMFQFYLRAEGLAPAWTGTGRFIFTHDLSEPDFSDIATRFVAAADAMQRDGWWWQDAALTNTNLKRRVLGDMLRVSLGRGPWDRSTAP